MTLIPTTNISVSPDDYKRKIAYALMQQGMDTSPVQHWTQGAARALQGALGGYEMYQDEQQKKGDEADTTKAYLNFLQPGGGQPPAPQAASPAPMPSAQPPAVATPPMGNKVAAALAGGDMPVTGPRPGGPVMPSATAWGDKEAEDAGLYEKPAPQTGTRVASAFAALSPQSGAIPVQSVPIPAPRPAAAALSPPVAAPLPAPSVVAQTDEEPDKTAKIRELLQSPNKAERLLGKSLAENAIAQSVKPDDKTDHITDYKFYAKQEKASGREPLGFQNWMVEQKKAGAQNISVDTKGENAFSTKAGQLQAERYDGLASEGQGAKQMLSDVQTLTQLGKTIQTGKLAEAKAAIGPYAQALGIDVKGLSEIQAFEAIVNRVAPSLRVKGSGAQSDFELKNFLKSLPSLGNTEEGNAIASKTMEGLYQNKLAAAEIGSKALSREITPAQADKMLRELPDHMEAYREFLKNQKQGKMPDVSALKKKYGLD